LSGVAVEQIRGDAIELGVLQQVERRCLPRPKILVAEVDRVVGERRVGGGHDLATTAHTVDAEEAVSRVEQQ
jgi:hypothetical protein